MLDNGHLSNYLDSMADSVPGFPGLISLGNGSGDYKVPVLAVQMLKVPDLASSSCSL